MGTWGPALFSDDTACDVRDEYRDLVSAGADGPSATNTLLDRWSNELRDPETRAIFWLALAATQWRLGRLENRVRQSALDVLDSGADSARWADEPKLAARRRTVLDRLRRQLQSPQPAEKKLRRPFRQTCDWDIGEVVVYKRETGSPVLLRTVDHHSDKGGVSPVCDVLEWEADHLPSERDIASARPRSFAPEWDNGRPGAIILGATSAKETPEARLVRTGLTKRPRPPGPQTRYVVLWREIDEKLRQLFGI